jgi:small neutral amino acid transporter SnatA (MarC family)
MTAGDPAAEKREQAVRATVISSLMLVGFALAGAFVTSAADRGGRLRLTRAG